MLISRALIMRFVVLDPQLPSVLFAYGLSTY